MDDILKKINQLPNSRAHKIFYKETMDNIAKRKVEVVGPPAADLPDDVVIWGSASQAAELLYNRRHSIFLYNLPGLRRRPTHIKLIRYRKTSEQPDFLQIYYEYCLTDAASIRLRWNRQRPNHRGKSWKKIEEEG